MFNLLIPTICLLLELCLGQLGLPVPMVYVWGFYFALSSSKMKCALPLFACSAVLDLAFGRSIPVALLGALPLLLLAALWNALGNKHELLLQAIPGALLGAMIWAIQYLAMLAYYTETDIAPRLSANYCVILIISSAIALPAFIKFIDLLYRHLEGRKRGQLDWYHASRENYDG